MTNISILSEHRCHLGEGPFYCERRSTLFWFDILEGRRHAHNFLDNQQSSFEISEMASAMAVIDDQHDAILTETGLWALNTESTEWSSIITIEADNPMTRSNDARVHPAGAFWLGTMGKQAEEGAGAIYHYRKGNLTKLFDAITIPNGICFSPDGKAAYFTDTVKAKLMQISLNPATGLPEDTPEILLDHTDLPGGLDGAIVDADGNIWIALWGASCVHCYSPQGSLLKTIGMPTSQCSCTAFIGGGNIAVTSAWQGMDKAARAKDINAGKTFVFDAGAQPKFEPRLLV